MLKQFSIGLTGGIGSGKTTVANLFANHGAHIIDTDEISHQLCAPGGQAIALIKTAFDDSFIKASGALDRAKMREFIFTNPKARKKLEDILHPLITQVAMSQAATNTGIYPIFVVPLLVESTHWAQRVSRITVVDCQESSQIKRVMARSKLTEQEVRAIMSTQVQRDARLAAADDIVTNDGNIDQLTQQVSQLHSLYCALMQK